MSDAAVTVVLRRFRILSTGRSLSIWPLKKVRDWRWFTAQNVASTASTWTLQKCLTSTFLTWALSCIRPSCFVLNQLKSLYFVQLSGSLLFGWDRGSAFSLRPNT